MSGSLKIMSRSFEDQQTALAGKEPVGEQRLGFADLPESCIASILGFTSPRDVARLACASRAYRNATSSDQVWQMMLPRHYTDILAQDPTAPPSTCSKKGIYDFLSDGAFLQNGTQKFWLDRSTGGVYRSMGARALGIIRGDDRQWDRPSPEGSRFSEVAYLTENCWPGFAVHGKLQSSFPPGTYSLSWRLFMPAGLKRNWYRPSMYNALGNYNVFRLNYIPLKLSFEATDNESVDIEMYLTELGRTLHGETREQLPPMLVRYESETWIEIDVGEFTVGTEDAPVELTFSITETECRTRKSGIFLDGVVIRPSFT